MVEPERQGSHEDPPQTIQEFLRQTIDDLFEQHPENVITGPFWAPGDRIVTSLLHLLSPPEKKSGARDYHLVYDATDFIERTAQWGIMAAQSRRVGVPKLPTTTRHMYRHYVSYEGQEAQGVRMQRLVNDQLIDEYWLSGPMGKQFRAPYDEFGPAVQQFSDDLFRLYTSEPLMPRTVIIPKSFAHSQLK